MDKIKYMQSWRARNPDRVKAHHRKWYLAHKEEHLKKCKEYFRTHRKWWNEYFLKWAKANPQKFNAIQYKYRKLHREDWNRILARWSLKEYWTNPKFRENKRFNNIISYRKRLTRLL